MYHFVTLAKLHQFTFKSTINKTTHPFELIHLDTWGPSFYESKECYKYYISFVDDFKKFVWLFPMQVKSEVANIFWQFNAYDERVFERQIKYIQMILAVSINLYMTYSSN